NDGQFSIWHSNLNSGKLEWWQVDLGQAQRIAAIEIAFRNDEDQPATRRNFEVLVSNNANFSSFKRLAQQGETALPFRQSWSVAVADATGYRYVRIRKTKLDAGLYGEVYFNLAEVRVFVRSGTSSSTTAAASSLQRPGAPSP